MPKTDEEHPPGAPVAPVLRPLAGIAGARRVVLGAMLVTGVALAMALLLLPTLGDGARERSAAAIRALRLTSLSMAPSGSVLRQASAAHPAVLLEHVPGLRDPRRALRAPFPRVLRLEEGEERHQERHQAQPEKR